MRLTSQVTRYAVKAFQWTFAPFVDHWSGLSLTRILAVAFAALVCGISWQTKNIQAGAVTLAVFSLATAFGRTVFVAALARWRGGSESIDKTENITMDETVRQIQERRDTALGIEPS